MELITKRIKSIYGALFILGTMFPYMWITEHFSISLTDCISFEHNHPLGEDGEMFMFMTLLVIAAGITFIIMDFLHERYITAKSRRRWLKVAKWVAIICVGDFVLLSSSMGQSKLSFLAHMGIGFWLLIIALIILIFEKQIVIAMGKDKKVNKE